MPTTVQLPVVVARRLAESSDPWQAAVDHEHLRLLALGLEATDLRGRAIVALANTDAPSRIGDLETILLEESTPARFRHLAATLLGRVESAGARDALVAGLGSSDPRLVGQVAQSLGRIGDRSAFKPIEKASAKLSGVPLAQARFALRLLAHRLDLELPDWQEDEVVLLPKPGEDGNRFVLTSAHPIEAQIAARSLAQEPFGIELNESSAQEIRCDESRLMLMLDRNIGLTSVHQPLLARKRFAGIVGRRAEASGLYSAALLMLTTPAPRGKSATISLYQPNGTLVLTGTLALEDETLTFELRGVARRGGVAMHVKGAVTDDGISLTTARVGCSARNVGQPGRLVRPGTSPH